MSAEAISTKVVEKEKNKLESKDKSDVNKINTFMKDTPHDKENIKSFNDMKWKVEQKKIEEQNKWENLTLPEMQAIVRNDSVGSDKKNYLSDQAILGLVENMKKIIAKANTNKNMDTKLVDIAREFVNNPTTSGKLKAMQNYYLNDTKGKDDWKDATESVWENTMTASGLDEKIWRRTLTWIIYLMEKIKELGWWGIIIEKKEEEKEIFSPMNIGFKFFENRLGTVSGKLNNEWIHIVPAGSISSLDKGIPYNSTTLNHEFVNNVSNDPSRRISKIDVVWGGNLQQIPQYKVYLDVDTLKKITGVRVSDPDADPTNIVDKPDFIIKRNSNSEGAPIASIIPQFDFSRSLQILEAIKNYDQIMVDRNPTGWANFDTNIILNNKKLDANQKKTWDSIPSQ